MSEAEVRPSLSQRLLDAGGGRLRASRRLNGEVEVAAGLSSSASLCLSDRGLFLVFSRPTELDIVDLLAADRRLRYHAGILGDRLEIDEWMFGIPWRQGPEIRSLIGRARLRRRFGAGVGSEPAREPATGEGQGPWAWTGPFVDAPDALEREWLRCWLDADEHLLGFKRSDDKHRFVGTFVGDDEGAKILVITDRRQKLLALSSLGDLWSEPLPDEPLVLERGAVSRPHLRSQDGRVDLRLGGGDEPVFAALGAWLGLEGSDRVQAFARALWALGDGGSDQTRAAAILDELAADDPLARLALVLIVDPRRGSETSATLVLGEGEGESGDAEDVRRAPDPSSGPPTPVIEALTRLVDGAGDSTAEDLVRWWADWELGPELGELVVGYLCELGPGGRALALPLHRRLREIWLARLADDPEDAALIDFVLAEHLLGLERPEEALELLSERRAQLPSEQLQDLLPPSPERGGQRIRIELYELAAAAHEQLGDGHVSALAELARLQPLVRSRLDRLLARLEARQAREGPSVDDELVELHRRASRVRSLLEDERALAAAPELDALPEAEAEAEAEGSASEDEPVARASTSALVASASDSQALDPRRVRALDAEQLELVRHPAARVDGVLGRLQGTLAKVVVPDCSLLKSYCERANLARTPALARAMADATMILGLGGVEVFVSRGDKSVGLRAYEGSTSFLLIGGDHLDPDSDAFLDESLLRFAITAELAHLRYAHSRVTSNEVWAGTVDLGLTGLGMLIVAAPILKGLKAPAKHLLDKVGAPAIERWRRRLASRDPHSLANDNSQVIAAYRVMQLSADRAGLLACGDPRAAIQAMFSVHPAYLALWPLVASHGLRAALTKSVQSEDERTRLEDLAVRVAALLSFYLSDEYAQLREAVLR